MVNGNCLSEKGRRRVYEKCSSYITLVRQTVDLPKD